MGLSVPADVGVALAMPIGHCSDATVVVSEVSLGLLLAMFVKG